MAAKVVDSRGEDGRVQQILGSTPLLAFAIGERSHLERQHSTTEYWQHIQREKVYNFSSFCFYEVECVPNTASCDIYPEAGRGCCPATLAESPAPVKAESDDRERFEKIMLCWPNGRCRQALPFLIK